MNDYDSTRDVIARAMESELEDLRAEVKALKVENEQLREAMKRAHAEMSKIRLWTTRYR